MSLSTFNEYIDAVKASARELDGQEVAVGLVGGQTLTGTLTYESTPGGYPVVDQWPNVLTVTVSTKVHTVRLDHVSSIGQG
ncbi:hypothetical protein ACFYWX_10675 [Streptomyces sp. NPDC002888]|uniref:hypothetical protein n=1 Tax=Streptomyces sp. NPDC002888 TaxID=3364668 RepID=UPI0036B8EE28